MKAGLTFLGTGNYKPTTYFIPEKECTTKYFPVAFVDFFGIETLYLVVTDEAKKKHFEAFKKRCTISDIRLIEIPTGKDESELLDIFRQVVDSIEENTSIYIDITHSFRSIPFMILPILLFGKITKQIEVKKIVYGAFEAKDEKTNKTPVFDLTYFIEMIDWTFATDFFINHGNASLLKEKFVNIHRMTFIGKEATKSKKLSTYGNKLDELFKANSLNRIKQTLEISKELSAEKNLTQFKEDINNISSAKPIESFMDIIADTVSKLSAAGKGIGSSEGLKAQCNLLDFYIKTEQYVQAITLERELVVTKLCVKLNINPLNREDRKNIEESLGKLIKTEIHNKELEDFRNLWWQITDIRNDIDHAGMREGSISINKAISKIRELKNIVQDFVQSENSNLLDQLKIFSNDE